MSEYTTLLRTKTFWLGLFGILLQVAAFFKVDLGFDANGAADVMVQIISGISFFLAIVFRQIATKQVVAVASVTPQAVAAAEAKKQ
jgi:hypothetical protein